MGRTAIIVAVFYGILAVLSLMLVLVVWLSTRKRDRSVDTALLARREKAWFGVTVALLVSLLFATIFFTPYGKSAGTGKQVVKVTAAQFAWTIEPSTVRANVAVEFDLTATDVNHALGLYDHDDVLLMQVQVPPDHHQKAVYTFHKPGTYRILCLEYCGVGHHIMESTIEVMG